MKRYLRIVIMASGLSRRFGENKLLVEVKGKPMYHYVLENVSTFLKKYPEVGTGIVVSSYDEILSQGKALGLKPVCNEQPEIGQSESIKLGLSFPLNLDERDSIKEVAVFLTADQPWMKSDTLERFLLKALRAEAGFLCSSFDGVSGNPVSFDERYYPELMELKDDRGGKSVMKKHQNEVNYVEMDGDELRDVDIPEDLA